MIDFPLEMIRRFETLVNEYNLSEHLQHFRQDLRPGFAISGVSGKFKTGGSRFGGVPDVPPDFRWPKCRLGYLLFVGQINLAELPKFVDA